MGSVCRVLVHQLSRKFLLTTTYPQQERFSAVVPRLALSDHISLRAFSSLHDLDCFPQFLTTLLRSLCGDSHGTTPHQVSSQLLLRGPVRLLVRSVPLAPFHVNKSHLPSFLRFYQPLIGFLSLYFLSLGVTTPTVLLHGQSFLHGADDILAISENSYSGQLCLSCYLAGLYCCLYLGLLGGGLWQVTRCFQPRAPFCYDSPRSTTGVGVISTACTFDVEYSVWLNSS